MSVDTFKKLLKIPIVGPALYASAHYSLVLKKIQDIMVKGGELIVPPQKPMFQSGGIVEGSTTIDVTISTAGGESWFNKQQFIDLQKAIGKPEEDAIKEWNKLPTCSVDDLY